MALHPACRSWRWSTKSPSSWMNGWAELPISHRSCGRCRPPCVSEPGDVMADALLDFQGPDDLTAWLAANR